MKLSLSDELKPYWLSVRYSLQSKTLCSMLCWLTDCTEERLNKWMHHCQGKKTDEGMNYQFHSRTQRFSQWFHKQQTISCWPTNSWNRVSSEGPQITGQTICFLSSKVPKMRFSLKTHKSHSKHTINMSNWAFLLKMFLQELLCVPPCSLKRFLDTFCINNDFIPCTSFIALLYCPILITPNSLYSDSTEQRKYVCSAVLNGSLV